MITYSVPITREFDINVVLSKWDKHEFEVLPLVSDEEENWESWLVYRKGYSTTPFVLVSDYESELLTLYMEELASYKDYEFFPFFCKELANYFEIDTIIVRIIWLAFTLAGGAGVLLYIIAALIIPEEDGCVEN